MVSFSACFCCFNNDVVTHSSFTNEKLCLSCPKVLYLQKQEKGLNLRDQDPVFQVLQVSLCTRELASVGCIMNNPDAPNMKFCS